MDPVRDSGRFEMTVASLSGLAATVLVTGTLAVEQLRVTQEIQLWAPPRVQIGDPVPVRVRVFGALDAHDGPRVITPETWATMRSVEGSAGTRLDVAAFDTLAGDLGPADATTGRIRAHARDGQLVVTAERAVEVASRVEVPLPVRPRVSDALQVASLARPPALLDVAPDLDVAVVGGVCVPEQPCTVVFLRGASELVPRLAECTTLDLGATRAMGALVEVDVVVHGAEARCAVALDPTAITTTLQLPVGLATPWIDVTERAGGLLVRGEPPVGRDAMLIDVFVGERWVRAGTLARGATMELALEADRAGLYRVQARADLDSSERAYQRALLVRGPSAPETALDDALAARFGEQARGWSPALRRWQLLALDADLVDVPTPSSGLAEDEARLARARETMRAIGGAAVLLAVLVILGAVLRRGLASAREAREVMLEAGAASADDRAARWRSRLAVLGYVAAIALAILLGAAFLVARPLFMG